MSTVKGSPPRFRVGDMVTLRYGLSDVPARIIEDRGPLGVRGRRLYRVLIVDDRDFEVPEEDLQPATVLETPVAKGASPYSRSNRAFSIQYFRQANSNRWIATVERQPEFDDANASGVVAYSTARWSGEPPGDEKFATVTVIVGGDPRRGGLADEAWRLADQRFKAEHPEARIEHELGEE